MRMVSWAGHVEYIGQSPRRSETWAEVWDT